MTLILLLNLELGNQMPVWWNRQTQKYFIVSSSVLILICMRNYRNYSDEDIISFSKEVKSIAGLLKKLKLKEAGGNYANIKKNIQRLNINTDHWTGQGWNKNERLKDWSEYTKSRNIKLHLTKHRGHRCECCKLENWLNNLIPLELHHKDGDRTNNQLDNLELLCLNCHYQTDNFRNRKRV